jgi:hypothetical protein
MTLVIDTYVLTSRHLFKNKSVFMPSRNENSEKTNYPIVTMAQHFCGRL